jgi:hypothetical protein
LLFSLCSHQVPKGFHKYVPNSMPNLPPLPTLVEKPVVTGGLSNGISHITRLHAFECGRVVDYSFFRALVFQSQPPPPPPQPPLNHDSRNFPVMLKIYDSDMIEGDERATHPPTPLMWLQLPLPMTYIIFCQRPFLVRTNRIVPNVEYKLRPYN